MTLIYGLLIGLGLSFLLYLGWKYRAKLITEIQESNFDKEIAVDRVEDLEHTIIKEEMEKREDEKDSTVTVTVSDAVDWMHKNFSKDTKAGSVSGVGIPKDPK